MNEFIKDRGGKPFNNNYPEVDEDGYSEFQLWHFMNIYGPHMKLGFPEVVKPLVICISDEDLYDDIATVKDE